MEFIRCSKGHFYDPSVTSICPQCAAEAQSAGGMFYQAGNGATEPVSPMEGYGATEAESSMEDYGATEPVSPMENFGATEPLYGGGNSFMGGGSLDSTIPVSPGSGGLDSTVPVSPGNGFVAGDFGSGARVETYDDATQPTITGGVMGFTPVTGWLVCIDGPAKGMDYRIRAGYNYIGRAEHMDICVTGDNRIGHERHAMIAYDQEEKVFFFGPADGKSIVRINDKMVMIPSEIHAYDVITIGSTKLMFVPLCGERFNWNE